MCLFIVCVCVCSCVCVRVRMLVRLSLFERARTSLCTCVHMLLILRFRGCDSLCSHALQTRFLVLPTNSECPRVALPAVLLPDLISSKGSPACMHDVVIMPLAQNEFCC